VSQQLRWNCDRCQQSGVVPIPRYGADAQILAASAHRIVSIECADEWGSSAVRIEQGEYPD
jgi:hypothetical protein